MVAVVAAKPFPPILEAHIHVHKLENYAASQNEGLAPKLLGNKQPFSLVSKNALEGLSLILVHTVKPIPFS